MCECVNSEPILSLVDDEKKEGGHRITAAKSFDIKRTTEILDFKRSNVFLLVMDSLSALSAS